MPRYEYKVVPAPRKGEKTRLAKSTPDRFAVALTTLMNQMGSDGWDYLRVDALPCDERVGLTGSKTTFQNMLVFRREVQAVEAAQPLPLTALDPAPTPAPTTAPTTAPALGAAAAPIGLAPALGPADPSLAAE